MLAGLFGQRRNILIQAKEVRRVVVSLDSLQALPALLIRFGNAFLFVAAHEIYIHTRLHVRPQAAKQTPNPRDVRGIVCGIPPIC